MGTIAEPKLLWHLFQAAVRPSDAQAIFIPYPYRSMMKMAFGSLAVLILFV